MSAKVRYVLSRTDALFPQSLAPGVMRVLEGPGVAALRRVVGAFGHSASGLDREKWAPTLRAFMAELIASD